MDEVPRRFLASNLLWPGMIISFFGIYGYLSYHPELDSVRPRGEMREIFQPDIAERRIFARLWEDPLGVPYRTYVDDISVKLSKDRDRTLKTFEEEAWDCAQGLGSKPVVIPIFVDGSLSDDAREERMRTRYAVISALTTGLYFPDTAKHIAMHPLNLRPFEKNSKGIDGEQDAKFEPIPPTLVVPCERFRPSFSDEFYDHDREACFSDVIVLWLDEDQIHGKPLATIHRLMGKFQDKDKTIPLDFRVLGPNSTDGLVAMMHENPSEPFAEDSYEPSPGEEPPVSSKKLRIYSMRSTAEPEAFKDRVPFWDSPSALDSKPLSPSNEISRFMGIAPVVQNDAAGSLSDNPPSAEDSQDAEADPWLDFVQVTGTDWHLAHAIQDELRLRNAWPIRQSASPGKPATYQGGCVVLIAERDTLYGRHLPALYRLLIPDDVRDHDSMAIFGYLRGIDGAEQAQVRVNAKEDKSAPPNDRRSGYDPTGTSQADYLRRLTERISELDHRKRTGPEGKGVLAIGVIGSDVYDKLLILRALRKQFPHVVFFTHDLDAEFCRLSELEYTSNLIVASHFGLSLHPTIQRTIPPFRRSYQTATFLATLMIIDDHRLTDARDSVAKDERGSWHNLWPRPKFTKQADELEPQPMLDQAPEYRPDQFRPLVFEIGRTQPYQLTLTKGVVHEVVEPSYKPADYFETDHHDREAMIALDSALENTAVASLGRLPDDDTENAKNEPSDRQPVVELPRKAKGESSLMALIHPPSPREQDRSGSLGFGIGVFVLVTLALSFAAYFLTWIRRILWSLIIPIIHLLRIVQDQLTTQTLSVQTRSSGGVGADVSLDEGRALDWHRRFASLIGLLPLLALSLLAVLWWLAMWDHRSSKGEPFVWAEGISLWPTILIRFITTITAFAFMVVIGIRSFQPSLAFLEENVYGEPSKDANVWQQDVLWLRGKWSPEHGFRSKTSTKQDQRDWRRMYRYFCMWLSRCRRLCQPFLPPGWDVVANENKVVCQRYARLACCQAQRIRSALLAAVFIAFALLYFYVWDAWPNCPYRGNFSYGVCMLILAINIFAVCWLVFYVVDAIYTCQRLVRVLGERPRRWTDLSLRTFTQSNLRSTDVAEDVQQESASAKQLANREALEELVTIRLIGQHTNKLLKTVQYPFVILLLMIVARSTIFDSWNFPLSLSIVMGLMFIILMAFSFRLRIEAADVRNLVLRRLRDQLMAVHRGTNPAEVRHIENVIKNVETEQDGAFRPLSEDWLIRATAIPFAGSGGLLLFQEILKSY